MKPSPPPEFSRPLAVDRVPRSSSVEEIAADPDECRLLAKRLGLEALHSLNAKLTALPWQGGGLQVNGSLVADLEQLSVISLEPFRDELRLDVHRYFVPPGAEPRDADDEAEVDPIEHGHIDLGEVVTETLALGLDPYPRKPGEEFSAHQESEAAPEPEKANPFAALSKLKAK